MNSYAALQWGGLKSRTPFLRRVAVGRFEKPHPLPG